MQKTIPTTPIIGYKNSTILLNPNKLIIYATPQTSILDLNPLEVLNTDFDKTNAMLEIDE